VGWLGEFASLFAQNIFIQSPIKKPYDSHDRIASGILGASEVIMTDLLYALPLMRENVKRNEMLWRGNNKPCQQIECKECDWFRPPPMNKLLGNASEAMHPEVILVADCVWISSLIEPLLQTLKMYTMDCSTKVVITYQQRGKEAHDEFWNGIHGLFDVVVVDTETSVGLTKPDVFHVFECIKKK